MSNQKGNVSRSRGQKHQNLIAFKNDKYGASAQVKVSSCYNKHCSVLFNVFISFVAVAMFKILFRVFCLNLYAFFCFQKAKTKVHDGLCQHCKGVLEWKVKYNKYKPLTQLRKW